MFADVHQRIIHNCALNGAFAKNNSFFVRRVGSPVTQFICDKSIDLIKLFISLSVCPTEAS